MVESPGWELYSDYLQSQYDVRIRRIVATAPDGVDSIVNRVYTEGECAGLDLSLRMINARIVELEEFIDENAKDEVAE